MIVVFAQIAWYNAVMARIHDELCDAIEASGLTHYKIAKGSGVAQSQLSRLVHGQANMSADNIERVAEFLGLEITLRPKRSRKGK